MRINNSLWKQALMDVKAIDIFMILFLISVIGFFLYVHYVFIDEADTKRNFEKLNEKAEGGL
jgi:hypothetical protein